MTGEELALLIGIIGLVVALAALALPVLIERLRRPRLQIEAGRWGDESVAWRFAVVKVTNRPLRGLGARVLTRQSAEGTIVSFTIRLRGADEPLVENFPGRWSGHPEPYRQDVKKTEEGWAMVEVFDHTLVPGSYRFDVPSTGQAEEVAVAVWRDESAYLFNSDSYRFDKWHNPAWGLPPGDYEVIARASAPGSEAHAAFTLTVAGIESFELKPA